ncbi:MAG: hypothetical protein QOJ35_2495, partial [Solirubrobacteraceae bacterium]|nr:hypothetical protein [Solirubrobacteraceae bacterium]
MELSGYAPLTTRARAATAAICTVMAVELCVIAADVYVLGVLGAPVPTADDLDHADRALGLAGLAELVMWVVGGVFFIRWFARAYRNLDVLAPGLRTHTPGWAIWGWITPVMSLFRPKQIADQIARCRPSEDGAGALLGAWWGLFIGGSLLSNGVGRLAFYADTSEQVKTAT